MGGLARALSLPLLTLSLGGCGTTAPWYRGSTPSASTSDQAHDGDRGQGSEKPASQVLVEYDRFKDDTHLYTRSLDVVGNAALTFSLHAFLHGNRTRLTKHEAPLLLLGFSSRSEDSRYLESQGCIFLVNGRDRIDLGDGTPSGIQSSSDVSASLTFSVTTQLVKMLLNAATIEARLGTTEFTVAPRQLSPFRELLEMIRAPEDST